MHEIPVCGCTRQQQQHTHNVISQPEDNNDPNQGHRDSSCPANCILHPLPVNSKEVNIVNKQAANGKNNIQNLQHYKNTKCLLWHFVFYYWINVIIKVKNTKCPLGIILIVL
jgi:hypothetical protein